MREAEPEIRARDADVVIVGTGAGWQAERLMADGYPFECLVDPEANLYRELGIGRVGPTEWLRPSTLGRYARAFGRGGRQGKVTGDWRRLSGVAIVDPERRVRWSHLASGVGDYPTVGTVLDALAD